MTIRVPQTAYEKVLKSIVATLPGNVIKITSVNYSYILEAEEAIIWGLYAAIGANFNYLEQIKSVFDQKLKVQANTNTV